MAGPDPWALPDDGDGDEDEVTEIPAAQRRPAQTPAARLRLPVADGSPDEIAGYDGTSFVGSILAGHKTTVARSTRALAPPAFQRPEDRPPPPDKGKQKPQDSVWGMFGIGRGGKQQVTPATAKDSRAEQKPTAGQPKPKAAVGKGIKPVRKPETDSEDDAPLPQLAPPRSASPEKLQLMGTRSKGFGKDANDGDLEVSDTDDEPEPGEGVDLVIHNVPSATMVPALLIDRLVFDFLCWDFTRSLLMEWTYAEKADWIHRKIEAYRAGKEECDGNTDDELREKNPDDPFWAEDEVALMDPRRKRDDQKHWRDRRKLNFPQLHELLVRKASRWFDRVDRIGELIELLLEIHPEPDFLDPDKFGKDRRLVCLPLRDSFVRLLMVITQWKPPGAAPPGPAAPADDVIVLDDDDDAPAAPSSRPIAVGRHTTYDAGLHRGKWDWVPTVPELEQLKRTFMDFTGWFYETVQKDEGFYEQGRPGPRRNARRRDPEELVEPVVLQLEWYYVLEGIMGIEALRKVEAVLAGPADSPLRSREELKKLIEGCLREAVVSSHVAFSGGNNYRIRKTIAKAARQDRDELADDILARALAGPARIRELLEDEYHYGTAVQELETFVRSVYDLMMLEDVAHDEEKLHAEEKRGMGVPYILKVLQNSEVHSALSASGMSLEKLRAAAREALQNENAGKAGPFKAPGIGGGAQRVPVPPKGSKGAPTEVVSDGSDDDEPKRPAGKGGKRGGRRIIFSSDDDEYAAPPEPKSKPKPKPPPANTKPGLVKALNNNASKAPAAPPVQYGGPPADRNQWNTPGGPRNPAAAAIAGNPDAQHQAKKQKVDGKKGLAGSVDAFRQAREWPGVMSPVQTSTAVAKSSRVVSTEPDPHYTLVLHDKRPAPKPSQGAYLIDSDEEGKEPPQKRPKVVLPVENDYTKSPFFRK